MEGKYSLLWNNYMNNYKNYQFKQNNNNNNNDDIYMMIIIYLKKQF